MKAFDRGYLVGSFVRCLAALLFCLVTMFGGDMVYPQTAPYVKLTGTMVGPNGLPVTNNVINFKPSQIFYVGGLNTTADVYNLYANGVPPNGVGGACDVSAQFYTDTTTVPGVLYQCQYGVWVELLGGGSIVTSVGLALPSSVFVVTNSPVTGIGTLTGSFISQAAHTVFAAPLAGGIPVFRVLDPSDLPTTLSIELEGVPVATQNVLNFLNTPPTPTAGASPVHFSADAFGGLGGDVNVNLGGSLSLNLVPPVTGQYVIARATVNGTTGNGGQCATTTSTSTDSTYEMFTGPTGGLCSTGMTGDWSSFTAPTLPGGATITAMYPFGFGGGALTNFTCSYNGGNAKGVGGGSVQQWTGGTSGWATDLSKVTCHYSFGSSSSGGQSFSYSQSDLGVFVYYTGSAPPTSTNIQVVSPLKFDSNSLKLSVNNPAFYAAETGVADAYVVALGDQSYGPSAGVEVKFTPAHNNATATPTVNLNGFGTRTIVGPTGLPLLAGDLVTSHYAELVFNSSQWYLQNPQKSGVGVYTVSTLPVACSSTYKTLRLFVSDATAPTYLGTLTGTGAVFTPVMCDGTNWVAY